MAIIQQVLDQSPAYIPLYKQAFEIMRNKPPEEHHNVAIHLCAEINQDLRR
jgi:hypothetical protein